MTIHLPKDLERYIRGQVQSGRFASADEAIAEAVRLLRQQGQERTPAGGALTEKEWELQLVQAGLLRDTSATRGDVTGRCPFEPVRIEDEPLSETVIRERR